MARIIPFPGDPHEQVQALLPWYVNGTLDDADAANVDAHLAECARCRTELGSERALRDGIATTGIDPDQGWSRVRASIADGARKPPQRSLFSRRIPIGWAMAAQLAVAILVVVGATSLPSLWSEPRYRTLGAATAAPVANAIVLFRADTDIADVRAALTSVDSRIIDGPTTSGAYLLTVPAQSRQAALTALRTRPSVVLAEPLDAAAAP